MNNNKHTEGIAYQVKGKLSNSDKSKTVTITGLISKNEAMDYAAMFHSIDEIEFIKQGTLEKGIFIESHPNGQKLIQCEQCGYNNEFYKNGNPRKNCFYCNAALNPKDVIHEQLKQ